MNNLSKPFKNSYWLLPDKILAGEVPVGGDEIFTRKKIESLLGVGIRVFINLLYNEPFEYAKILKQIAKEQGITCDYLHYPILDMGVPENTEMKSILDAIDRSLEEGKSVYYHCYAGLGRTGLVSCCWLARHENLPPDQIFELLNQIRKEQNHMEYWDSPQSQIQYDFVTNWQDLPF